MNTKDLDRMLAQYVITALWSSTDETDGPITSSHDQTDIAPAALSAMRKDCQAFGEANAAQIEQWGGSGDAWGQAGHDFWCSRNGAGIGFWNHGELWPKRGLGLTKESRLCGPCDLYVGDDSLIHLN